MHSKGDSIAISRSVVRVSNILALQVRMLRVAMEGLVFAPRVCTSVLFISL